jgi:transposase, IS5 family
MRSNRIDHMDLFTNSANENYQKHIKTQSKQALEVLKEQIDWNDLVKPIERILRRHRSEEPAGRKPISLLVIIRCFILQTMYGLSDPRLEEEIADRRSFQLFLDMNSGDSIPDETTICRYRELFSRLKLDDKLLHLFNRQLNAKGLFLNKGTLIDATLKVAQATKNSGRDKDAKATSRKGKPIFGYKGHIGMDSDSELIHSVEFTSATVSDSEMFDRLIHHKEKAIIADKGYTNRERKQDMRAKGIYCGIMDRAFRAHPLSGKQIKRNRKLSAVRNPVERPFAFFKRILDYDRCSYYDLRRNRFEFLLAVFVYNMRRYLTLRCQSV